MRRRSPRGAARAGARARAARARTRCSRARRPRAARALDARAGAGDAALQRARRGELRRRARLRRPRAARSRPARPATRRPSDARRGEAAAGPRRTAATRSPTASISADSHPVSGGFVFAVGDGAAPAATVDELLAGGDSGPVTSVAFAAARAVQYGAIALAIGALVFLLWAWLPALRAVAGASAAWQAASSAFAARLRAAARAGGGRGRAERRAPAIVAAGRDRRRHERVGGARPGVVGDVLATRFGLVWGLGLLAWLAVRRALALGRRCRRSGPPRSARPAPRSPGRPALAASRCRSPRSRCCPALGGHAGGAGAGRACNLPGERRCTCSPWARGSAGSSCSSSSLRHATARARAPPTHPPARRRRRPASRRSPASRSR